MYFGAEHLIGFFTVVPSAQWYSYLGGGEGRERREERGRERKGRGERKRRGKVGGGEKDSGKNKE